MTKGGVTSLTDDEEDPASAVDQPGAEPRRAGSLPSNLSTRRRASMCRVTDHNGPWLVRVARARGERAGRPVASERCRLICRQPHLACIALCFPVLGDVYG